MAMEAAILIRKIFFFQIIFPKDETQAWKSNNNISWLGVDANENIWCMFANAPGFWILDKEFKIKMHRNPFWKTEQFKDPMNKLLFDNDNNIWCATNKGLYRYNI